MELRIVQSKNILRNFYKEIRALYVGNQKEMNEKYVMLKLKEILQCCY